MNEYTYSSLQILVYKGLILASTTFVLVKWVAVYFHWEESYLTMYKKPGLVSINKTSWDFTFHRTG
jgi:hypothetical protein